jgi:hypothetical protein
VEAKVLRTDPYRTSCAYHEADRLKANGLEQLRDYDRFKCGRDTYQSPA